MADGDLLSLLLKVEGGTASAAEILKVEKAIQSVDDQSKKADEGLQDRFQHGFQHIALKGFISDAARSIGLGGELRPIIGLLNTGFSALEHSIGGTAAAFIPYAAGLAAITALGFVAYEHFKKHAESLDELSKKQLETTRTTDELKDSLSKYRDKMGELPPILQRLYDATGKLDEVQMRHLSHIKGEQLSAAQVKLEADKLQISNLESQIEEQEKLIKSQTRSGLSTAEASAKINSFSKNLRELNDDMVLQDQTAKLYKADIDAIGKGALGAADSIKKTGDRVKESNEFMSKLSEDMDKDADKFIARERKDTDERLKHFNEIKAGLELLKTKTQELSLDQTAAEGTEYQKREAEIEKFRIQHLASAKVEYQKLIDETKGNEAEILRIKKAEKDYEDQLDKTVAAKHKANLNEYKSLALSVGREVTSAFSSDVARTIVEGKNLEQALKQSATMVAEHAIAKLLEVGIEEAALAIKRDILHAKDATGAGIAAAAKVKSSAVSIAAINTETAAVVALDAALATALATAVALDVALAAIAL